MEKKNLKKNLNMKKQGYFEGWYIKQQNQTEAVAFIPAFHKNEAGEKTVSLQIITNDKVYHFDFPLSACRIDHKKDRLYLDKCVFSEKMCLLQIQSAQGSVSGILRFGRLTKPRYDIMGPFSMVPFLQCRHSVFSLTHTVNGKIEINDQTFEFQDDLGYMEGDRGRSFPKRYIWTQCNWEKNSLMLSVADIPFGKFGFTGCIGFIYWKGQEYRIATYLGVRLIYVSDTIVIIRQGELLLTIRLLEENNHLLKAPQNGKMTRHIAESLSCTVHYKCALGDEILFDFVTTQASFESNWEE